MLNEKVHERYQRSEESAGQVLPILDSLRIWRTQRQTTQCPRQRSHQIADHEDIMPIVIIRARNICPSSAGQSPEHTHASHELGQRAVRPLSQAVPQKNQHKSRSRTDRDEDLEDGAFGVAITNRCAHGGEPFDRVAEMLVLHDFMVVQRHTDD